MWTEVSGGEEGRRVKQEQYGKRQRQKNPNLIKKKKVNPGVMKPYEV